LEQRLLIDGKWTDGSGDRAMTVLSPAPENDVAQVPAASVSDAAGLEALPLAWGHQ